MEIKTTVAKVILDEDNYITEEFVVKECVTKLIRALSMEELEQLFDIEILRPTKSSRVNALDLPPHQRDVVLEKLSELEKLQQVEISVKKK